MRIPRSYKKNVFEMWKSRDQIKTTGVKNVDFVQEINIERHLMVVLVDKINIFYTDIDIVYY